MDGGREGGLREYLNFAIRDGFKPRVHVSGVTTGRRQLRASARDRRQGWPSRRPRARSADRRHHHRPAALHPTPAPPAQRSRDRAVSAVNGERARLCRYAEYAEFDSDETLLVPCVKWLTTAFRHGAKAVITDCFRKRLQNTVDAWKVAISPCWRGYVPSSKS